MPHSTPSGVELYACIPPVETGGYSYWSPPDFLNLNNIALKGGVVTAAINFFIGNVIVFAGFRLTLFAGNRASAPLRKKMKVGHLKI
jgi:hypothetical protein